MDAARILVIDDDNLVRDMVRDVLADANYDVVLATNGNEGLATLGREKINVVVTDILMPEKEGVETIFEIKKSWPHVKIVAMSGGGRTGNLQPLKIARRAGADVILTKPFEPDGLLDAVRSLSGAKPPKSPDLLRKLS